MRQYFAQRDEEQREMRRLVEATMAGHQNTREARKKLYIMKQKIGKYGCVLCQGFWNPKAQVSIEVSCMKIICINMCINCG